MSCSHSFGRGKDSFGGIIIMDGPVTHCKIPKHIPSVRKVLSSSYCAMRVGEICVCELLPIWLVRARGGRMESCSNYRSGAFILDMDFPPRSRDQKVCWCPINIMRIHTACRIVRERILASCEAPIFLVSGHVLNLRADLRRTYLVQSKQQTFPNFYVARTQTRVC